MPLRRIFALTSQEWGLLLIAAVTLVVVRITLWVVPSRRILHALQRRATSTSARRRASTVAAPEVVRAVERASRLVPRATCLTQALSARFLLARFGHPSLLRLGVARGDSGAFRAHAWLEWQGEVLIGRGGRRNLTPLPDLPSGRRTLATGGR